MVKSWLVVLLGCLLCVGVAAAAAEEKKKEKKEEKKPVVLPAAIAKTVADCCKDAVVEECKEKKEGDKVCSYEVKCKCTCKDAKGKGEEQSFKLVVAPDGKLIEASKHKEPSASLPAAVASAVSKWAPGAKLCDMVKVETKKDSGTVYEVKVELNGKELAAKIAADGKVIKADKLPEPKAEKKEEKKK